MATTQTLPFEKTLPDIFYEDPEPVEDGMLQGIPLARLITTLHDYFADQPDVFVNTGAFVMWNPADGNERIVPDCFIAFGVDVARIMADRANYRIWAAGKPPDFVLEMASPSTAEKDLEDKRELYAWLGVAEYWRMDPVGGEFYGHPLIGERLVDGAYEPYEVDVRADGSVVSDSELLGLRFRWREGWGFDVLDPDTDRPIDDILAEREARMDAEARAEAERERAEAEREGRLIAEIRADSERDARLAEQARADAEREARLAAQTRADAAEARERALQAELDRLRRRQPKQ